MGPVDFFTYGVFNVLSWSLYQSSLHSVSFSRVWVTSFAWQIPDVLPEFISGSFVSLSDYVSVCLKCRWRTGLLSGTWLVNSLPPRSRKKNVQLSSLRPVANTFCILSMLFPCIKKSWLYVPWTAVLRKFLQSISVVSILAILIENY